MASLVKNILLAAAFIAIAAFLDYLIRKCCDTIENRLDTDECKDAGLFYTMSVYPCPDSSRTDPEACSEAENSREVDTDDTDRFEGQEEECPASGAPVRISDQSAAPPECS